MFLCYVNKTTFTAKGKTATKYEFLTEERKPIFCVDWDSNSSVLSALVQRAVYEADGPLESFKDEPRIKIATLIPRPEIDVGKFIKISSIPKEQLTRLVYTSVAGIKNQFLNSLAERILEEEHEKFFTRPAAKTIHHGWVSGLAEHSFIVMSCARALAQQYKYVFPNLNDDLITFGALFHDLGKIEEYDSDGIVIEFTYSGELVPHVVRSCLIVSKYIDAELSTEDKKLLDHVYHILISHHGLLESGSPVKPKSPEAVIISAADDLDAELIHAHALMQTATNEFTERSKTREKAYLVTR